MPVKLFFDTNILVYAYDMDAPSKRAIALNLVEEGWRDLGAAAVSVQVLQELHVNLVRKGDTKRRDAGYSRFRGVAGGGKHRAAPHVGIGRTGPLENFAVGRVDPGCGAWLRSGGVVKRRF